MFRSSPFVFEAITHTPEISLDSAGSPQVGLGPLGQEQGTQATYWHPGPCVPRHQACGPTGAWPWLTSGQSTCHTEDRGRGVPHCGYAGGLPFQSSVGSSAHSLGKGRASRLYGCAHGAEGLRHEQRHGHNLGRGRGSRHCGPADAGRGQSSG